MKRAIAALALVAACASPTAVTSDATPADAGAPADALPSPFVWLHPTVDLGYVPINSGGAGTKLTVTSTAGSAITDFAIGIAGGDTDEFLISQSTCMSTITDGCSLVIAFAPHAAGEHTLSVSANAPGYAPAIATIHVIAGSPPPGLATDSGNIDLGSVTVGSSADKIVTFRNAGTATLMPIALAITGEAPQAWRLDADHCSGEQLPASGECSVDVVYAPTDFPDLGTATLLATAGPITLELALRATAVPGATIAVSPTSYDFGVVQAPAGKTVPFTVTNTGTTAATGFGVHNFNAQYAVASTTCTASLAPGASCIENIRLVPTTPGDDPGGMEIGGGNVGFVDATFSATGIPAEGVILDTYSHDFGSAAQGTTGNSYTFTVTNVGTQPQTITYSYDDAQESFPITQDHCSSAPLPASGTCTFTIAFAPPLNAGGWARIHVMTASDDAIAVLTGTVLPPLDMPLQITYAQEWGSWAVGLTTDAMIGVQNPGAVTKTLTASIVGADAGDFAIGTNGCAGVPLPMSGACQIQVLFAPQSAGMKAAKLQVVWSDGMVQSFLSGTAYVFTGPLVVSKPRAYDFGGVSVGQTATVAIPFTNYGAMATPPLGFVFDNAATSRFSLANDGCTGHVLATNATCSLSVVFAPTATGAAHEHLTVTSSENASLQLDGLGQ